VAQLCGIPTSLGYAAALIWCVKAGVLRPVLAALEAVGRMALSNYFLQTILCTTLFYGYGFGLFAKVGYPALFGVAAAVWAVNIAFSLLWLRVFRFGPAEWLWRTLTYLRPQPMRRPAAVH
jgi:Predicted membrane protein